MCKCPGVGPVVTVNSLEAGAHATRATGAGPLVTLNKVVAGRVVRVPGGSKVGQADTRVVSVRGWAGFGSTAQLVGTRRMFRVAIPRRGRSRKGRLGTRTRSGGEGGPWGWCGEFGYEFFAGGRRWQGAGGERRRGGEGNHTPLPVGEVLSDRDQALQAMVF